MKIGNFPIVQRAMLARAQLLAQRDTGTVQVMISGRYQDDAMVEAIRPAIQAELDRRIAELDADLVALGVELA